MKALVKNELRLTRKLLLIWMGIVLILCGFAYFEYLSLKESLNELTGLISNFPKILKAMFGVSGDLTSALGWYGCMYYWVTMLRIRPRSETRNEQIKPAIARPLYFWFASGGTLP